MYEDLFHNIPEGCPNSGEPYGDFIFKEFLTSRSSPHIFFSPEINIRTMICTKGEHWSFPEDVWLWKTRNPGYKV